MISWWEHDFKSLDVKTEPYFPSQQMRYPIKKYIKTVIKLITVHWNNNSLVIEIADKRNLKIVKNNNNYWTRKCTKLILKIIFVVGYFHNFNSLLIFETMFLKPIDDPEILLNRTPCNANRGNLQISISHCVAELSAVGSV